MIIGSILGSYRLTIKDYVVDQVDDNYDLFYQGFFPKCITSDIVAEETTKAILKTYLRP